MVPDISAFAFIGKLHFSSFPNSIVQMPVGKWSFHKNLWFYPQSGEDVFRGDETHGNSHSWCYCAPHIE